MISPRLLISTSIKHVQRHGWTKDALAAGAVELGLPPVAHGLVARGGAALVEEHMRVANEQFKKELDEFMATPGVKSNRQIVEFGLWSRLKKTTPLQHNWAQAMAIGAKPENVATTVQQIGEIADAIASKMNDQEEAYEWYANRAAISAAYGLCELHMLSDYSEDFQNTRRFLQNRVVNDGSRIMQTFHGFGDMANSLAGGFGTTASVGLKMGLDVVRAALPMNPLIDFLHRQTKAFSPPRDEARDADEDLSSDESLIDAKLPEGTSLFGLVSRDVKEAADLLREYNPDFSVIIWPMWESIPSSIKYVDSRRVVRLVHDKQNIVVDVLRM